jgi:integrase
VACWDLPHLARFLEGVQDDDLFALWWLVGLRPIRRGELVGLRWAELDFVSRELTIREQVTVTDRTVRVGPPKSMAGLRALALDETTVEIFWAHWRVPRPGVAMVGRRSRAIRCSPARTGTSCNQTGRRTGSSAWCGIWICRRCGCTTCGMVRSAWPVRPVFRSR